MVYPLWTPSFQPYRVVVDLRHSRAFEKKGHMDTDFTSHFMVSS
jgi:hypothetical protein